MPLEQPLRAVSYARGQRLVDNSYSAGRYSFLDQKVKGVALYGDARMFAAFCAFTNLTDRIVWWRFMVNILILLVVGKSACGRTRSHELFCAVT